MSRTQPNEFERLELSIPCSHCRQPEGEWCKTPLGRRTQYPHAVRYYHAKDIMRARARRVVIEKGTTP